MELFNTSAYMIILSLMTFELEQIILKSFFPVLIHLSSLWEEGQFISSLLFIIMV